jgi:FkbM family methyltransferase
MKNRRLELILRRTKAVFRIIPEGYGLRDKIILTLSIFYSLYRYLLNRLCCGSMRAFYYETISKRSPMRLGYYLWKDCLIKNRSGIFHCRAQVDDALIVSELYEVSMRHHFEKFKKGNFVDIGAHVGKYTVLVARQLQDRGTVVCIEAHPGNFNALKRNIQLNGLNNVIALNLACYSENGVVRLFQDSNLSSSGTCSCVEKFQGAHIMVEAKRLDDILKELKIDVVNLMKIDVEYAELEILKGAEELLSGSKVLKIIFEGGTNTLVEECTRLLEQKGYTVKDIGIPYYLAEPKLIPDQRKLEKEK